MIRISAMPATGRIAGVDEAGRGPLAGPVVAGAVILDPDRPIAGLADSKTLSASKREQLAGQITSQTLAWSVGWCDAAEIDSLNILEATFVAMRRALLGLRIRPDSVLVDGNRLPNLCFGSFTANGRAVVNGDARVEAIAAASIIAKVRRDIMMARLAEQYPGYGFERHKGYPTAAHRDCLQDLGPCPAHRRSFRPVSDQLAQK